MVDDVSIYGVPKNIGGELQGPGAAAEASRQRRSLPVPAADVPRAAARPFSSEQERQVAAGIGIGRRHRYL
ncbi:hypothetical protein ABZ319_28955 [Nocardia sp. NPDC005978]|uniref:hypothetical protein n=1 Tax=Nocardia sp. NPDC005978 TaxID=3156725 RepID=UPI0033BBEB6C